MFRDGGSRSYGCIFRCDYPISFSHLLFAYDVIWTQHVLKKQDGDLCLSSDANGVPLFVVLRIHFIEPKLVVFM